MQSLLQILQHKGLWGNDQTRWQDRRVPVGTTGTLTRGALVAKDAKLAESNAA